MPRSRTTTTLTDLTRREALTRFAVLAAGASAIGATSATAASSAGLTPARTATAIALAAVYRDAGYRPAGKVSDVGVEEALRRFYASATGQQRDFIDALLDALEVAADGTTRFSVMTVAQRRRALRAWAMAREADDDLMLSPRPTDPSAPTDLAVSLSQMQAAVTANRATIDPAALDIDPQTGLPAYAPPSGLPKPITRGEPLGTVVRQRRFVRQSAFELLTRLTAPDAVDLAKDTISL